MGTLMRVGPDSERFHDKVKGVPLKPGTYIDKYQAFLHDLSDLCLPLWQLRMKHWFKLILLGKLQPRISKIGGDGPRTKHENHDAVIAVGRFRVFVPNDSGMERCRLELKKNCGGTEGNV